MTTKCWKCDVVIFEDSSPGQVETNYYTCHDCKKKHTDELLHQRDEAVTKLTDPA